MDLSPLLLLFPQLCQGDGFEKLPLWRGPLRTSARRRQAASPSSRHNFCVACVEQAAKEVVMLYMAPDAAADQVAWARVGQFHADKMGYHDRMTLLRSQGAAEVVMWDPLKQLVLAVDVDSRITRSIGPLSGRTYYSDFVPYVNSYAEIYRWRSGQAWRRTQPRRGCCGGAGLVGDDRP